MKTRSMIPLLCATVAMSIAGCSDDSVTNPDSPFGRSTYNSTATTAVPDDGTGTTTGGTGTSTGGTSTGGTSTGGTTTGTTTQRPLSDFLSQQGTYCVPGNTTTGCMYYAPPVANFAVWYSPAHNMSLVVDYAGLMDAYLRSTTGNSPGTAFFGNVYETPLSDGTARINVNISFQRAMVYIVRGLDLANDPVSYGHSIQQILQGQGQPAFGQGSLRLSFINPAPGQPLPDLVQLMKEQSEKQMVTANFRFESTGEFYNEFGQRQAARISVTSKGGMMAGYPGMEWSTAPMSYVDMQISPM